MSYSQNIVEVTAALDHVKTRTLWENGNISVTSWNQRIMRQPIWRTTVTGRCKSLPGWYVNLTERGNASATNNRLPMHVQDVTKPAETILTQRDCLHWLRSDVWLSGCRSYRQRTSKNSKKVYLKGQSTKSLRTTLWKQTLSANHSWTSKRMQMSAYIDSSRPNIGSRKAHFV